MSSSLTSSGPALFPFLSFFNFFSCEWTYHCLRSVCDVVFLFWFWCKHFLKVFGYYLNLLLFRYCSLALLIFYANIVLPCSSFTPILFCFLLFFISFSAAKYLVELFFIFSITASLHSSCSGSTSLILFFIFFFVSFSWDCISFLICWVLQASISVFVLCLHLASCSRCESLTLRACVLFP